MSTYTDEQEEVFQRLSTYAFAEDEVFVGGAEGIRQAMAGRPEGEVEERLESAKVFYFARKEGREIDAKAYFGWRRRGASKVEVVEASEAKTGEPEYPTSFHEICALIAAGKPVPGIRLIPDTLASGTPSVATMTPRKKPWEKE